MSKEKKFIGFDHRNIIQQTLREVAFENDFDLGIRPEFLMDDWQDVILRMHRDGFDFNCHVQQMPGCCAVLIASYFGVTPWTKKAFAEAVEYIEQAAYRAGFGSLMLSQVRLEKDPRKEIWGLLLEKGFHLSQPFRNAKSGNLVSYLTKDLKQPGKVAGLEQEVWG